MNYVTVIEDGKYPLKLFELGYNGFKLADLCQEIASGRSPRFKQINILGGLVFKTGWQGKLKHLDIDSLNPNQLQAQDSLVLGYFRPSSGQIYLYPEAHLILSRIQLEGHTRLTNSVVSTDAIKQMESIFYQTLIEEIEHGYQDPRQSQYQPLLAKFIAFTSPVWMLLVIVAVAYIIFNDYSWWWFIVVFFCLITWIFLPVLISLVPKPRWWQRLTYKFNRREGDAKGKAVSLKLARQAREAIWFEPKIW